ncbi:cytidine/deoxycytidylate deaminase family protein, putative [Streptococcus equinus]|uniref:cytidine deaminase family protein n=1 Tax=Streptococcus equinus TaxID=1335 RepID=UPI000F6B924E|nr:cytidine deaminase [Streptococcus equinus]VEE21938.1 cytidine/deoxycytidylate deaminase family protein, putative [Streptococcus equinus]
MDIWEKLYEAAKNDYNPHYVTPFIYSNHVVAAIEAEDGQIFTGYCFEATSGVFHLCAERAAAFNMFQQTIKRIIAFRDKAPNGGGSGMPCGACREFLMQLSSKNKDLEFMIDYDKRETITLGELMPNWWGEERMADGIED